MKQRGFADDFIIKHLCQVMHIDDCRNVRRCKLCSFLWRPGSSTMFMCFFPQRTHLFSESNTVPMLICCFKHAWFRSFRLINPAPSGGLSGSPSIRSLYIAMGNTFSSNTTEALLNYASETGQWRSSVRNIAISHSI